MNRYIKFTIIILGVLASITQIVSIYLSNTKSLESIEATALRAKVDEISESNIKLQADVLALSSYNVISSRAGELGYKKTEGFVSLYDPVELSRTR